METLKRKRVLISGASMAGFSTAFWMNKIGYDVTVVELARAPRTAGGAINIEGRAVDAIRRMGLYERIEAARIVVEQIEFKNALDITEGAITLGAQAEGVADEDIEIERDQFIQILFEQLSRDVKFIFNTRISRMSETENGMQVTFNDATQQRFDLVIGCDGMHSGVRKLWFGAEKDYTHFLNGYFSITIVDQLLITQKTVQMYNEPNKGIMLNAYNHKTDIIYCFNADDEIPYDYRNEAQQRKIIYDQFEGLGWRNEELLEIVKSAEGFYFDKFCQVKMPSWTKGRVALIGDAAYCPSPAAGKGGSLAIIGATALADALLRHNGDHELVFADYNSTLRPYVEQVQAQAEINVREIIPRTKEAIQERNAGGFNLQ